MSDPNPILTAIKEGDRQAVLDLFGLSPDQDRALAGRLLPVVREMIAKNRKNEAQTVLGFLKKLDPTPIIRTATEELLAACSGSGATEPDDFFKTLPTPEFISGLEQSGLGETRPGEWWVYIRTHLDSINRQGLGSRVFQLAAWGDELGQKTEDRLHRNMEILANHEPRIADYLADHRTGEAGTLRWGEELLTLQAGRLSLTDLEHQAVDIVSLFGQGLPPGVLAVIDPPLPGFAGLIKALAEDRLDRFQKELQLFIDPAPLLEILRVIDLEDLAQETFSLRIYPKEAIEEQYPAEHCRTGLNFFGGDQADRERIIRAATQGQSEADRTYAQWNRAVGPGSLDTVKSKPPGRKIRIAAVESKFSTYIRYAARDLLSGFEKLGCSTRLFLEEDNQVFYRHHQLSRELREFNPDLMLVFNRTRKDCAWIPENLPVAWWMQDWSDEFLGSKGPGWVTEPDFIFGFHPKLKEIFEANHGQPMTILPVCADEEVYRPLDEPRRYDVSYVSHAPLEPWMAPFHAASDPIKYLHQTYSSLPDDTRRIFAVALVAYLTMDLIEIPGVFWLYPNKLAVAMGRLLRGLGVEVPDKGLESIIDPNAFRTEMHGAVKIRTLKRLVRSGIKVDLFGRGWELIPELAPLSHGPAANGRELNRITNQTRINLNINSFSAITTRSVEINLSGGFMLTTRKLPGGYDLPGCLSLSEYLEAGKESIWADDPDDLAAKIEYYLANPGERQEIAERARQKALRYLTTKVVAEKILEVIGRD